MVRRYLPRTPLVRSEPLSAELDADVYLKREDTLPTGAFKVRGGVTLASRLDDEFRESGLLGAGTGNHGQSIADAAREVGVPAAVVVPEEATPRGAGDRATRRGGAEARRGLRRGARTRRGAGDRGGVPLRPLGERTGARRRRRHRGSRSRRGASGRRLRLLSLGGGSGATGYCLTAGELADADVVGVQSSAAPAMRLAWAEGTLDSHDRLETFAEGAATRTPFALTTEVLRERLSEFLLVGDDELRDVMTTMLAEDSLVVEGATAAGVAGAHRMADDVAGSTVVIPVSGRNVARAKLRDRLAAAEG